MLSLSDSESERDPEEESDRLMFGAYLNAPDTTNQSSPKKGRKTQKNKEESAKLKEQKEKIKEEKAKLKEEKQKALEEKTRLKEEKKKSSELLKRQKPGECVKYISVLLDSDLTNCKFGGELLVTLQSAEIQYKVEKLKISHSVLWTREVEDTNEKYENHLLVIWTWNELVQSIASGFMDTNIRRYTHEYPGYKIALVVYGIEEYFRFQKTLKNRQLKSNLPGGESAAEKPKKKEDELRNAPSLTRFDIEKSVAKLQLLYDLRCRFLETGQELGQFVSQFTKALAELPFKMNRNKKQEIIEWYAVADSRECVKVDNSGNGLIRLWQQQICQFPNVGLDVAQSIVSEYNSPQALIEAYDKCKDRKEAELLLQNIPVRRSHGPLTSCRRIGPELSKKIFVFFNNLDGNVLLSRET